MKNFIRLILILTILSCKTENTDTKKLQDEIAKLKDSIVLLQKNISMSNIEEVTEVNQTESTEIKDYDDTPFEEAYNKIKSDIDTVNLLKQTKRIFILSEYNDIMRTLTNNWDGLKGEYFLSNRGWRSNSFLKGLLTDKGSNILIDYLKRNNTYKSSKTNYYVDGLIDAYNTINDEDHLLLEELHEISLDGYHKNKEEINNLLDRLNKLEENIFKTKFKDYASGMDDNGFILYSFWARRHNEGNKEVIYKILKNVQTKMNDTIVNTIKTVKLDSTFVEHVENN